MANGNPDNPFTRLFLASALGSSGRLDAVREQMAQYRRLRPGVTLSNFRAREPSDEPAFLRERGYVGLRAAGMRSDGDRYLPIRSGLPGAVRRPGHKKRERYNLRCEADGFERFR